MGRRRGGLLAKAPMSDVDLAILRALNANSASRFDQALSGITPIVARRDLSPAQRAQAYYALGQAYQGKLDYARAVDAYRVATSAGRHGETWVAPFGFLHMSECYLKLGDKEKWRASVDRARTFSGYDNEPLVRFQIERDVTLID